MAQYLFYYYFIVVQKFNKRTAGIEKILQQTSLEGPERAKWSTAQSIVKKLGKDGQSTDETDTDGQGLHSTVPYYRRRYISTLLEGVDNSVLKMTQHEFEQKGKRYTRRPTLVRRRTDRRNNRTVVGNLPRSCYHQRYLDGLSPGAIKELEIDPIEIPHWSEWVGKAMPMSDSEPEI